MINTMSLLLVYQLVGELLVRLFSLTLPGPVLGMALLFLTLLVRGKVSQELRSGTSSLLQHLSLLFVPAGVGVVVHLQRVAEIALRHLIAGERRNVFFAGQMHQTAFGSPADCS